jgi:Asp/Glu/hydantoin racemase
LVHDLVEANACHDRCVAIEALPVSVLDASDPQSIAEQLRRRAQEIVLRHRVQSIILGGAPLGVHADAVSDRVGVKCLNPIQAGVRRICALVSRPDSPQGPRLYPYLPPKKFVGELGFLARIHDALWPLP